MTAQTEPTPRFYLFLDSDCPLCLRFGQTIARWDTEGRIALVDLHAERARALLGDEALAAARAQLTARDRVGTLYRGIEALRRVADLLPGIRRLHWIYGLPGVTPVLERVYRAVHRHRRALCLKCGETWMPSMKWSRRHRGGRRR